MKKKKENFLKSFLLLVRSLTELLRRPRQLSHSRLADLFSNTRSPLQIYYWPTDQVKSNEFVYTKRYKQWHVRMRTTDSPFFSSKKKLQQWAWERTTTLFCLCFCHSYYNYRCCCCRRRCSLLPSAAAATCRFSRTHVHLFICVFIANKMHWLAVVC